MSTASPRWASSRAWASRSLTIETEYFFICTVYTNIGARSRGVHRGRDDAAVEEIDPARRARDVVRIVGREADRGPAGVQLFEHLHHGFAALRVEIAGRLVGKDDRRTA